MFLSAASVLLLSISIFADTIRLKDGSIIKGTIVSFTDGRFTVAVGDGARRRELSLLADEIASIEFEPREAVTSARVNQPSSQPKIVPVSTKQPSKPAVDDSSTSSRQVTSPQTTSRSDTSLSQDNEEDKPAANTNSTRTAASQPVNVPASSKTAPLTLNVRVLADNTANGWTNSGYVVKKGQRIRITGDGTVSLGKGQTSTPGGLAELEDSGKLLKMVPTGALIAVIGDDNNDFIYIGSAREFTAGRDGALYLGVNEGNLNDNSGAYNVKVEIIPAGS
jgi:hypothetical protein